MNAQKILISRLEGGEAKVAIIGLGCVGLPMAVEFAAAGLETVGVDLSEEKVAQINVGESYIADVPSVAVRKLRTTTDSAALCEVDCICISVPTPLSKIKDPDISYIVAACDMIVENFRPGVLVGKDFFSPFRPNASTRAMHCGRRVIRPRLSAV